VEVVRVMEESSNRTRGNEKEYTSGMPDDKSVGDDWVRMRNEE
jgi:hypothetical protein